MFIICTPRIDAFDAARKMRTYRQNNRSKGRVRFASQLSGKKKRHEKGGLAF